MRYSLWSNGRLVGYTFLDIHTVSANLRQGFIEPTEEGEALLREATGVPRAMAAGGKLRREQGNRRAALDLFRAACDRREALNFELRDESEAVFECDFMRVWDLRDVHSGVLDETDLELDDDVVSSGDEGNLDAEDAAEFEASVEEWIRDTEDEQMYHSGWPPPPPPDERWDTMQYHLQVFLKTPSDVADE